MQQYVRRRCLDAANIMPRLFASAFFYGFWPASTASRHRQHQGPSHSREPRLLTGIDLARTPAVPIRKVCDRAVLLNRCKNYVPIETKALLQQ